MRTLKAWESWLIWATAPEAARPRWFQRAYVSACIAESVEIARYIEQGAAA